MRTIIIISAALALAMPSLAFAQAQTSLASLRVGYTTRKATVKPEGDLKTQIDAVDRELAEATRLGRTGEVRRLLAKGTTLLAGRAWTAELEFTTSVVIRSDRVVVDSNRPYTVRLEQIYAPALALESPLAAHLVLRQRPTTVAGGSPVQGAVVRRPRLFRRRSARPARCTVRDRGRHPGCDRRHIPALGRTV